MERSEHYATAGDGTRLFWTSAGSGDGPALVLTDGVGCAGYIWRFLAPDLARTITALGAIGVIPRGERETDSYGAPMRQVFFRLGQVILELVGQPDATGEGDPGFFGLAITVDDLDAAAALLGEHLGGIKDAVQDGRRIATLRHRDLGMSVATALMSPG